MKQKVLLLMLIYPMFLNAQGFTVAEKFDSLHATSQDTLYKVSFKLDAPNIEGTKEVTITAEEGGSALNNVHFTLRDAYNKNVNSVFISNVENSEGTFNVMIPKGLDKIRTIYLKIIVKDNGVLKTFRAHLFIVPREKKDAVISPKDLSVKKDTILKKVYTDINIRVKRADGKPSDSLINIQKVLITDVGEKEYDIDLVTTENDHYSARVKLDDAYKFSADEKLFLNGDSSKIFIDCREFLQFTIKKVDETIDVLTPAAPLSKSVKNK